MPESLFHPKLPEYLVDLFEPVTDAFKAFSLAFGEQRCRIERPLELSPRFARSGHNISTT